MSEIANPAVTVIIPTLDEAAELPATLDSVMQAFGGSAETIVVDGGSTDGTVDIALARARLVQTTAGRGRQLNAGLPHANGELLLFLHADTWLAPTAGAALKEILERPEIVGGCFRIALRGPSSRRRIARLLAAAINLRSRWLRTATGDQAIFARRAALERIGGFPEWALFEDVGFYRRLRQLGGGDVLVVDQPVLTSDRRWRQLGYLRTIGNHVLLRSLFLAGVSPLKLARLYRRVVSPTGFTSTADSTTADRLSRRKTMPRSGSAR